MSTAPGREGRGHGTISRSPVAGTAFSRVLVAGALSLGPILLGVQPYWERVDVYLGDALGFPVRAGPALFTAWLGLVIASLVLLVQQARVGQRERGEASSASGSASGANGHASIQAHPRRGLKAARGGIAGVVVAVHAGLISYAAAEPVVERVLRAIAGPVLLAILLGLLAGAGPVVRRAVGPRGATPHGRAWRWRLGGYLATLAVVAAVPLLLVPPLVARGVDPLPPKPTIVAHRGASHYAPENTLAAGEAAVALNHTGVNLVGCEWDVRVSADGVLFLMHDTTLRRTTNVAEVFPGREQERAENFTLAELRQLDAGSWFVDGDPHDTIRAGIVPGAVAESYRGAAVPTFAEVLAFSREHGLAVDVDLKAPPGDHPFAPVVEDLMVNACLASGLGKRVWFATDDPRATNLTRVGVELVNTNAGIPFETLRAYYRAGTPVMVWTVDDPYQFSTLWVAGAAHVKTNRPWMVAGLERPLGYARRGTYYGIWVLAYLLGAGHVGWTWRRETLRQCARGPGGRQT